jgi:hypothetical protein
MYKLKSDLTGADICGSAHLFGQSMHFTFKEQPEVDLLNNYLQQKGHENICIEPITATIEDCFIALLTEKANSHDNK